MSQIAAEAFIDQVAADPDLLLRLEGARHSEREVADVIAASGFDATPVEVVDAFLERFGRFLNDEQLAQISGGSAGYTFSSIEAIAAYFRDYLRTHP